MYSMYVSTYVLYVCVYVHTYVCTVCMYVCTYLLYVGMYIRMYVFTYVLYECIYVRMYICSCVCGDWHSHALQGEIRATAFNEAADKFYHVLEVDKVYYITKCQLKPANKQFTSLKNDYEMYIREETEVEEVRVWEGDGVVGIMMGWWRDSGGVVEG